MEITLFGIKIRVELAIACMILGALICYMLFCSCSLKEGKTASPSWRGPGRISRQNKVNAGPPSNNHNNGHGGAL